MASVSLLVLVRIYGGSGTLELAGADEHVCTTAAVMQQVHDNEIARELGVNLHRSGVADDDPPNLYHSEWSFL